MVGGSLVLVFFLGFSIDIAYIIYINSVREGHKIKAGAASVLLAAPALFGFMSILEDKLLMIPYFLGLFCGTIVAMAWHERHTATASPLQSQKP